MLIQARVSFTKTHFALGHEAFKVSAASATLHITLQIRRQVIKIDLGCIKID